MLAEKILYAYHSSRTGRTGGLHACDLCRILFFVFLICLRIRQKFLDVRRASHHAETAWLVLASRHIGQFGNIIQLTWILIVLCLKRLFALIDIHVLLLLWSKMTFRGLAFLYVVIYPSDVIHCN